MKLVIVGVLGAMFQKNFKLLGLLGGGSYTTQILDLCFRHIRAPKYADSGKVGICKVWRAGGDVHTSTWDVVVSLKKNALLCGCRFETAHGLFWNAIYYGRLSKLGSWLKGSFSG